MKEDFQNESALNGGLWLRGTKNRYRDWDESHNCFLSISLYKESSWPGKVYLIVTETEVPDDPNSKPVRQVPSWLRTGVGRPEIQDNNASRALPIPAMSPYLQFQRHRVAISEAEKYNIRPYLIDERRHVSE